MSIMHGSSARRALLLGATGAASTAAFSMVARATTARETASLDRSINRRLARPRRHPARRTAAVIAPAGKWWIYVPVAAGVAAYILNANGLSRVAGPHRRKRQRAGAIVVALSAVAAAAAGPAFDRWLPQPRAPPGQPDRGKPVFPSGHTFGPAALSFTSAYVLAAEGRVTPRLALPAALMLPIAIAGGKLVEQKHWASDVVGGYLAGAALAACCLAAYESMMS